MRIKIRKKKEEEVTKIIHSSLSSFLIYHYCMNCKFEKKIKILIFFIKLMKERMNNCYYNYK
jgi:hypothetical protein